MKTKEILNGISPVILMVLAIVDMLFPQLPPYPGVRPAMGILVFGCIVYGRQIAMARTAPQAPSEVRARITDSLLLAIVLIILLLSTWTVSRALR